MDIIFLIIGIACGTIIGWFIAKNKFQQNNLVNNVSSDANAQQIQLFTIKLAEAQLEINELSKLLAEADANNKNWAANLMESKNKNTNLESELILKQTELSNLYRKYSEKDADHKMAVEKNNDLILTSNENKQLRNKELELTNKVTEVEIQFKNLLEQYQQNADKIILLEKIVNEKTELIINVNKLLAQKESLITNFQQLNNQLSKDFDLNKMELSKKIDQINEMNKKLSANDVELKTSAEKLSNQKNEIENLQKKFTADFENLANKILEDKSQKFTDQNKINLDRILSPLSDKIKEFEKKVDDTYNKESTIRLSLVGEIKKMFDLNQQISIEANNLTKALKGQSKTIGNWGEMILENILEKSGLTKDREYTVQQSFTNAEGKRFQPDIVVNYPGNRFIVIDSKVSLNAYERFSSLDDKELQDIALEEHIKSIKTHISELNSKNYQNLNEGRNLEYVLMFIPIEPAYLLAIQNDNTLWNFAYEKRILIISPTNLVAILKIISEMWRVESQNKNAIEIAQKSGDLYDKFVGLLTDLLNLGKKIDDTQIIYNEAINKLNTGKGNLIKRAEDLRELGAKTKKQLPQIFIDKLQDM